MEPFKIKAVEAIPATTLAEREAALAEAGISDVASFTAWYWDGQMGSARLVIGSTLLAAIIGGLLYLPSAPRVARHESSGPAA